MEQKYVGSYQELVDIQTRTKNGWVAPTLFVTYYGPSGFKFEVDAREFVNGVATGNHDVLNIDGPNRRYVGPKTLAAVGCCWECGKEFTRKIDVARFCNWKCHRAFEMNHSVKLSKSEMYEATKRRFWKAWNEEHKGASLQIAKTLSSYGL